MAKGMKSAAQAISEARAGMAGAPGPGGGQDQMDPRCVDYDKDGKLANYEDRCVIAYLVATVQLQKQQIAQLQRRHH